MRVVAEEAWMADAACRTMDTELFFPARGRAGQEVDVRRLTCAACPVRAECLEYALVNVIQHGVWGGTSERERRVMRNARRAA